MNKLNWPTAFVVIVIVLGGVLLYNKPITASNTINDEMIIALSDKQIWQLKKGQVRWCMIGMGTEMLESVRINEKYKWNSATGKYDEQKPKLKERMLKFQSVACSEWSSDKPTMFVAEAPK